MLKKVLLLVGLVIVGLVIIVMVVSGVSEESAEVEVPTSVLSATPVLVPTATPERVWTAVELVTCDTTTLTRQLRDDRREPGKGEQLSDCEVALFTAYLGSSSLEQELTDVQWVELEGHKAVLERFNQFVERLGNQSVTVGELSQWCLMTDSGLVEAQKFAEEHGLLGLEVDFLKARDMQNKIWLEACQ